MSGDEIINRPAYQSPRQSPSRDQYRIPAKKVRFDILSDDLSGKLEYLVVLLTSASSEAHTVASSLSSCALLFAKKVHISWKSNFQSLSVSEGLSTAIASTIARSSLGFEGPTSALIDELGCKESFVWVALRRAMPTLLRIVSNSFGNSRLI